MFVNSSDDDYVARIASREAEEQRGKRAVLWAWKRRGAKWKGAAKPFFVLSEELGEGTDAIRLIASTVP